MLYNNDNPGKFSTLTTSTKLMIDITTPPHGPSYQTLETDLNFAGGYLSSYGTNNYQFVDGNPGGARTRTTSDTQTFTWDFGGAMEAIYGQLWPSLSNYVILHIATGNGGAAAGDPTPDATAEYFLDNVRVVDEDTTTRSTWQTVSAGNWTDPTNWANGVPNAANAPAIFYGIGAGTGTATANASVGVNSAVTVGSIILDLQMTTSPTKARASPLPTSRRLWITRFREAAASRSTANQCLGDLRDRRQSYDRCAGAGQQQSRDRRRHRVTGGTGAPDGGRLRPCR